MFFVKCFTKGNLQLFVKYFMVNEKFYKFDQILLASKHLEKKKKNKKQNNDLLQNKWSVKTCWGIKDGCYENIILNICFFRRIILNIYIYNILQGKGRWCFIFVLYIV